VSYFEWILGKSQAFTLLKVLLSLQVVLFEFILPIKKSEILLQISKRGELAQLVFDPLRKLSRNNWLLVPFVDQKDACVVIDVANTPANDLVDFSHCLHFVPHVTSDHALHAVLVIVNIVCKPGLLTHAAVCRDLPRSLQQLFALFEHVEVVLLEVDAGVADHEIGDADDETRPRQVVPEVSSLGELGAAYAHEDPLVVFLDVRRVVRVILLGLLMVLLLDEDLKIIFIEGESRLTELAVALLNVGVRGKEHKYSSLNTLTQLEEEPAQVAE